MFATKRATVAMAVLLLCVSTAAWLRAQSLDDWGTANRARASGQEQVDALFLVKENDAAALSAFESTIRQKSGSMAVVNPRIGYVRARIPLAAYDTLSIDAAVITSRLDGYQTPMQKIGVYQPVSAKPLFAAGNATMEGRLAATLRKPLLDLSKEGADSPAFAASALGLSAWQSSHPTFDGRGVTIANIEGTGELDHPALQQSLTADGRTVPKARALLVPPLDRSKPTHSAVDVHTQPDGSFTVDGVAHKAHAPGAYQFQRQAVGQGFYRPRGRLVAMLSVRGERTAWVDVNDNHDFSDEVPIRDFNDTHEIGYLPYALESADAARGEHREGAPPHPLAFLVYFEPTTGLPRIVTGDNGHSTATDALLAGDHYGGGAGGSAAPNARLALVVQSRLISGVLEAVMVAAFDDDVDLVSSSTSAADIANAPSAFESQFLDRVVRVSGKPQFWSAGNAWSATASVYTPTVAKRVLSVGGYVSAAAIKKVAGFTVQQPDWLMPYSYGPSNWGQMKPDMVAPSPGVAPTTCGAGPTYGAAAAIRLPPCYRLMEGTSAAAPVAASAAAALISGARQKGLPHDAGRIYWALKAGARYLPDWPAHAQGAGLINLSSAWQMLTMSATWPTWRFVPDIDVRAPVRTRWTELTHETIGNGLYEREGWKVGDSSARTVSLTRRDGPNGAVRYALAWLGNDGTFQLRAAAASEIALERNKTLSLPVHVVPARRGVHSATLQLLDWETRLPVAWIAFVVVAADELSGSGSTPFAAIATVDRPFLKPSHHFVDVPAGTQVLKIDIRSSTGGQRLAVNPPLVLMPAHAGPASEELWGNYLQGTLPKTRTYLAPVPQRGVWEFIRIDAAATLADETPQVDEQYSFSATALAATLSAEPSPEHAIRVQVTNQMGALEAARLRAEIGGQRHVELKANRTVANVDVTPGTSTLLFRAVSATTHQPVRLWVYFCGASQQENCTLFEFPYTARPSVSVRRPEAGLWKLLVDASDLKDAPVDVEIVETGTRYGDVTLGSAAPRRSGETWTETLAVSASNGPHAGEAPVVVVELEDVGAEEKERAGRDVLFPQRPAAIGQAVVALPNRE